MVVDLTQENNLIALSETYLKIGGQTNMATSKLTSVKVETDQVKAANVVNAKIENDILTQEQIVRKSLAFFIENYPKIKVAGKRT